MMLGTTSPAYAGPQQCQDNLDANRSDFTRVYDYEIMDHLVNHLIGQWTELLKANNKYEDQGLIFRELNDSMASWMHMRLIQVIL